MKKSNVLAGLALGACAAVLLAQDAPKSTPAPFSTPSMSVTPQPTASGGQSPDRSGTPGQRMRTPGADRTPGRKGGDGATTPTNDMSRTPVPTRVPSSR